MAAPYLITLQQVQRSDATAINENDESGHDSGLEDDWSDTTSIDEEALRPVESNGRLYHSYHAGRYPFPNDKKERERLDDQHELLFQLLDRRLHLAPIEAPRRVLDIGTGTGAWAINCADVYPCAAVLGIDLSPIQPAWVPPNCSFLVDDFLDSIENENIDLFHARGLTGSIPDLPKFVDSAYKSCAEGGWLEISDWVLHFDNENSIFCSWWKKMEEAAKKDGRSFQAPLEYCKNLEKSGFVNVAEHRYMIPMYETGDPKVDRYVEWMIRNWSKGLEGFSLELMTKLGMSKDEVQKLCALVLLELNKMKISGHWERYIVIGQKPENNFSDAETLIGP